MFRRLAPFLLAAALLPACSLSQKKVADVDARMAASLGSTQTCPAAMPERCADASPVLELGRKARRDGLHRAKLPEYGTEALELRLHLFGAARRQTDLQNFILRNDDSGELVLNELLAAALRGVRVRLLLDQMFSFSDAEYLVSLTMAHQILEIRFYNPSFHKAEMAKHDWVSAVGCCFRPFNQRMHNKLLAVDDLVGVIGGRNVADRCFDFDTNSEFKDRDVAVYGQVVTEIRESFEWFGDSPKAVPVQHLRDIARELLDRPPARQHGIPALVLRRHLRLRTGARQAATAAGHA